MIDIQIGRVYKIKNKAFLEGPIYRPEYMIPVKMRPTDDLETYKRYDCYNIQTGKIAPTICFDLDIEYMYEVHQ